MRYLILSDIHSNLTALDAVLAAAKGRWKKAVCLGDLVGYGPDPNEVVERIRSLDADCDSRKSRQRRQRSQRLPRISIRSPEPR